jgi:hypothetical protein
MYVHVAIQIKPLDLYVMCSIFFTVQSIYAQYYFNWYLNTSMVQTVQFSIRASGLIVVQQYRVLIRPLARPRQTLTVPKRVATYSKDLQEIMEEIKNVVVIDCYQKNWLHWPRGDLCLPTWVLLDTFGNFPWRRHVIIQRYRNIL